MTKDEFKKFFKYVSSVTTDTNPSPERTQVYWDLLNDLDFNVAMTAGRKVIATLENPFLPMPAVFRSAAVEITGPRIAAAPDAYGEVMRAIRNFGSYRQKEALESMSPLTRRAVEAIGWKEICISEEPDVIRGQFRMAYEALERREMIDLKTPQSLKAIIADMDRRFIPAPTKGEENKKLRDAEWKEHIDELKKEIEDEEEE
jgi:hypothetical protein